MNIKLKLYTFAVLLSSLLFTGCGLSDKPVEGQDIYVSQNLKSSCEVDSKIFEKFFDEEIPDQIACLQKSLDQFSLYVKKEDERYISYKELERFARKFFPESKNLPGALKIFFKVNSLLLNDPSDRLSVSNVPAIFKLFTSANKQAVVLKKLLNEENRNRGDLWKIRLQAFNAVADFRSVALSIMPSGSRSVTDLDMHTLVLDLKENLTNTTFDIEKIESLFFAKKIVLGGTDESINSNELRRLISLAPEFSLIAFDLLYMEDKNFASKNERLAFFSKRLEDLRPLLYQFEPAQVVFTKEQILKAAHKFEIDADVLEKLEPGLDIFKEHLLGGRPGQFTFRDLNTLMSYGRLALEGIQVANAFKDGGERVKANTALAESHIFRTEIEKNVVKIKEILNRSPILPKTISLERLLKDANKGFKLDEKEEVLSTVRAIKKMLVGGSDSTLSDKEVFKLVDKAADLGSVAFDVAKIKNEHFASEAYYYDFLLPRLDRLNLLTDQTFSAKEHLIDVMDLLTFAERVIKDTEIIRYEQTTTAMLGKLYNSPDAKITYGAFKEIIKDGRKALESMLYNAAAYDYHQAKLNRPEEIKTALPFIMLPVFKNIPQANLQTHHDDFNKLVVSYRFFADEDGVQYYSFDFKRPRKGFLLAGLIKWGVGRIIQSYGHPDAWNPKGPKVAEMKDLEIFMYDLKSVLEANGLWTRQYVTFSRNMLLLADLFQYQSDGTMTASADELTEYTLLVFNAVKMNDFVYERMQKYCPLYPTGVDSNVGFRQDCVIDNYARLLLEEGGFKKNLPQLQNYKKTATEEDFNNFLTNLVKFTRDYSDDVPMDKREITMVTGALMNIESTFMRFDLNHNGYMDNYELENAYQVYRKAIIMVAMIKPEQEKFARSVFLYMIKYMKIPTPTELARFHFLEKKDKIIAKRLNIAAILYYLVQQAEQTSSANN